VRALPAGQPTARLERKFLADVLILQWPEEAQAGFMFDRGSRALAEAVAGKLGEAAS
jgi:hypothetical protein